MKSEAKKAFVGLHVTKALAEKIRRLAKTEKRSVSAYLRIVLEDHVASRNGEKAA